MPNIESAALGPHYDKCPLCSDAHTLDACPRWRDPVHGLLEALETIAAQSSGMVGSTAKVDCMAAVASAALRNYKAVPVAATAPAQPSGVGMCFGCGACPAQQETKGEAHTHEWESYWSSATNGVDFHCECGAVQSVVDATKAAK